MQPGEVLQQSIKRLILKCAFVTVTFSLQTTHLRPTEDRSACVRCSQAVETCHAVATIGSFARTLRAPGRPRAVLKNCSLCTPCKGSGIGHEKAPARCKGFGIAVNCGVDSYKKLPITNGDELGSLSLLPLSISKIAHIFGTTCVFINSHGSIIPRCGQGFSQNPYILLVPIPP